MAKLTFEEDFTQQKSTNQKNYANKWVSYFSIGDGDTAVVRFPYKSVNDFDRETVHTVQDGRVFRKVSCLRTAKDPIEKCPFCNSGRDGLNKFSTRFFIKMISYTTEDGNVVANPVVWDAPDSLKDTLKAFMREYGNDLTHMVFKVTRNGSKQDTRYSIIPGNADFYKEDIYKADFTPFNDFKLDPWFCRTLNVEEMNQYLITGRLPEIKKAAPAKQQADDAPKYYVDDAPTYTTDGGTEERPRRYTYNN